jgi:hypothetical protein
MMKKTALGGGYLFFYPADENVRYLNRNNSTDANKIDGFSYSVQKIMACKIVLRLKRHSQKLAFNRLYERV